LPSTQTPRPAFSATLLSGLVIYLILCLLCLRCLLKVYLQAALEVNREHPLGLQLLVAEVSAFAVKRGRVR
jgi:hypothetical protein